MRLINDLVVRGESAAIDELVRRLRNYQEAGGWRREPEVENSLREWGIATHEVCCFSRRQSDQFPAISFSIYRTDLNQLSSVSVVSTTPRHPLTDDQHNLLIENFDEQVVGPARMGLAVDTEIIKPRLSRLGWALSPEALRKLNLFAAMNRDRSILTPDDRSNWREFGFQVYSDGSMLDTQDLGPWLVEQGWTEIAARDLIARLDVERMFVHWGVGI